MLGDVLEELGEFDRARDHFLETLRVDSLACEERDAEELEQVLDATLEHLRRTVEELPAARRARLAGVPLLVQRLPSEDMIRTGPDPRAFGLFEGPMHADTEGIESAPLLVEVHLKSRDTRQTVTEASPGAGRERSLVGSGLSAPVSEHFLELARVERELNLRDAVRGEFAHPVGLKARQEGRVCLDGLPETVPRDVVVRSKPRRANAP